MRCLYSACARFFSREESAFIVDAAAIVHMEVDRRGVGRHPYA
jgi:hypothetical protein